MTRLSQVVAVVRRVKSASQAELTALYHDAQRTQVNGPLHGTASVYHPLNDAEEDEVSSTQVEIKAEDLIARATATLSRLWDVIATQDWANTAATADVKVGGKVILAAVPTTYLMFLDKQLTDLHTFVKKLPTLDPAEVWTYRPDIGCYASEPVKTARTRKLPRNHVLAKEVIAPNGNISPAQVQVYQEDQTIGYYTRTKFCGALPADRVRLLLRRVEELRDAVTFAREEANTREVTDQKVAKRLLEHLFAE